MSLNYARNLRNGVCGRTAPEGFSDGQWHRDASFDSGTSHTRVGRVYVVQCEWCDEAFAAGTAGEAMDMFRIHEEAMAGA